MAPRSPFVTKAPRKSPSWIVLSPGGPNAYPGRDTRLWTSFGASMPFHFVVGAARSLFTGRGVLRSGVDMFAVGLGVAAVGYLVGDRLVRWL